MKTHEKHPTPCQSIDLLGVNVVVKRDDLNHPVIQGNKLRKLKYNIKAAQAAEAKTLVTFGGAYSNHLLATAYAAKRIGLDAVGIVRGDELAQSESNWSSTLNHCHQLGMQLVFVTRADYRLKKAAASVVETLDSLAAPYVLPEGGSNHLAVKGVAEMVDELADQTFEPTHIICPVGTGGTVAGLVRGVVNNNWQCQVIGVAVLKGLHDINNDINQWLGENDIDHGYQILHDFSGGGYAKNSQELIGFSLGFEQKTGIRLDKVYNSKSFYALAQLIKNRQITSVDRPLIIHTGGLQGGTNQAKDLV